MIVQYVIDWRYIRLLIKDALSNDDKLKVIRLQLSFLRKGIKCNGVLFAAQNPAFLKELQSIIKEDLKYTDGGETNSSYKNLSDELESYKKLYSERRICLPIDQGSFPDILEARDKMLTEANLVKYDLPCAIITDIEINNGRIQNSGNTVFLTLDQYESSSIEECREKWEDISFDIDQDCEADRFWAGMSIGASSFKRVSLIDPFCLCVVFRDSPLNNWCESVKKIVGFFIRNNHIETITLVGSGTITGRKLHVCGLRADFQEQLLHVNRQESFRIGICVKPHDRTWHDRWIDIGMGICALDDGLEVYEKDSRRNVVIKRPFQAHVLKDTQPTQFLKVANLKNELYRDLCNGCARVDMDIEELKPEDSKNVVEVTVRPSIRMFSR